MYVGAHEYPSPEDILAEISFRLYYQRILDVLYSAKCIKFMRSQGFVPPIFTHIGSSIMGCILQVTDYIKGTEVLIPGELLTV